MNDISYIESLSDTAIMEEMGAFIKAKRIDRDLTQDELAGRAALSRSTLSLMERGENTSLVNLLKVLRVLDALYVLGGFKATMPVSPLQLAKEEEMKRKRASRKHQPKDSNPEW